MWRVVVPLVLTLMVSGQRELLYTQDGWIMSSGKLYEGSSPTRCSDGSIVYTHEGDLWRDGQRLASTPGEERNPSCIDDILYDMDGSIYRYPAEKLFEGTNPVLHEDGRIAYSARFQGIYATHIRTGSTITIPYKTYSTTPSSWGGDTLYFSSSTSWAWYDTAVHWSDTPGTSPCWTPEGIYTVWTEDWPNGIRNLYLDGTLVVENAIDPVW